MRTKYWYWIWKTFLGPSRLRKKFVRTFLIAGVIPLALMGGVSVYLVNLTHRIDVQALEENLARRIATEIGRITDRAADYIELRVAFSELAPIRFNQQDALLEIILKENLSIRDISFVCITADFCSFGRETKRWTRDEKGIPKASSVLRNRSQDQEFITAREGKRYIGPIDFKQELLVPLGAPNYNQRDQIVSVIAARMDLSEIQAVISSAELGETGYVYLTDKDGLIIAHPKAELIGKDASALPPVSKALGKNGAAQIQFYASSDGITVSGAGVSLEDLGWASIAEWPRTETQELIRTILGQVGIFSVLALLLVVVIASWLALRLIQPIAELSQGTNIIGSGNFGYRVQIKTGDELEDLGKNLNKMAESLKGLEELHELKIRTEALSESLRKERELSKLKDQFITTVSHQFNTPLAAINWATAALKDPSSPAAKKKEGLDIIERSQRGIVEILADLVTLSEIGFRYEKSKAKPVSIAALIQSIINGLHDTLQMEQVAVDFKSSTGNPIVEVNEFTMKRAIENLISNAVAYSNAGGRVDIALEENPKDLLLTIRDQGIGIPKDDQPLIFQQFFRGRNAVAKKNVGTGLGLFISKNVIEGHGGKIWFESEEGRGTTLHVTIPKATS